MIVALRDLWIGLRKSCNQQVIIWHEYRRPGWRGSQLLSWSLIAVVVYFPWSLPSLDVLTEGMSHSVWPNQSCWSVYIRTGYGGIACIVGLWSFQGLALIQGIEFFSDPLDARILVFPKSGKRMIPSFPSRVLWMAAKLSLVPSSLQ